MNYKPLGRTGVQVSPLCLGCMNFGWGAEESDSIAIILRALEAGINFLDTADVYGKGASETIVGKALQGRRDEVFLASKVHGKMGDGPNDQGNSRLHIIQGCEASLKRLGVDHIDLYQIHRPQSGVPIDETLRALDDLIRQGKVRYIGTSTFGAWQLVESLWTSEKLGLNRFVTEQPPYNLLDRRVERELLPMAETYGFGVIPWSPLAGGMLTGKYRKGKKGPSGSRYESGKFRNGETVPAAAWKVIEGVNQTGCRKRMRHGCLCFGMVRRACGNYLADYWPAHYGATRRQFESVGCENHADDKKRIDELIAPGTHVATYYQADFGPHVYR